MLTINDGVDSKLTILREVPRRADHPGAGRMVLTRCECGHESERVYSSVKRGRVNSCRACQSIKHAKDISKIADVKGRRHERLSSIWGNMKTRCYSVNHGSKYHKGRNIEICDEWINNREAFQKWALSNGYSDNLTIDRIDNDEDYSPSNCRWVGHRAQTLNSRVRCDNTTGFRCISPLRGKYQLGIDGEYIGVFPTTEEAVIVRDKILGSDRIV